MNYKITKGLILSLASDSNVYKSGENYYKEEHLKEVDILKKDSKDIVFAKTEDTFETCDVKIFFDRNGNYINSTCSCKSSGLWRGSCKHVVAVLFSLMDENSESIKRIREDITCNNLTSFFREQSKIEMEEYFVSSENKVVLEPTVYIDKNNTCFFELRIGNNSKKYIIKSIKNLIESINNKKTIKYGKQLEFKHEINSFDTNSIKLINLLKTFFSSLEELDKISNNYAYKMSNINYGSNFLITKNFFDMFFEIYKAKKINVAFFSQEPTETLFSKSLATEKFVLKLKNNFAELISESENFYSFEGEKNIYFLNDNTLAKMEKKVGIIVATIKNEMFSKNDNHLYFSGDNFYKFTSYILPVLLESKLIKNQSTLEDNSLVEGFSSKIYLDRTEKGLTCKPAFVYDKKELSLDELCDIENMQRNVYQEEKILNLIKLCGFKPYKNIFILDTDEEIFNFQEENLNKLREKATVFVTKEFEDFEIKKNISANFKVKYSGNLLEFNIDDFDYSPEELFEAIESYKVKKRFHKLKNGRFIDLEEENFKICEEIIMSLDISKKDFRGNKFFLPSHKALYVNSIFEEHKNVKLLKDDYIKTITKDFESIKTIKVPKSLENVLREYQKFGFSWLKTLYKYRFGGILADDMGLGKTIQIIALILSERDRLPSLVVTPSSVIYNWQKEFDVHAPDLKTTILTGTPKQRKELLLDRETDIFICTYDTLKRDINNYLKLTFNFLIADEAQYIKNPTAQISKAIKKINSTVRFALTGTPVENSLSELWSIFDFVMPGIFSSYNKFYKTYELPIIKEDDEEKTLLLRKQISPFILRRLKSDVLKELPNKFETILYCDMLPEQRKIYSAYLLEARKDFEKSLTRTTVNNSKVQIFSHITRLRQICCHPQIFLENYEHGSGKFDLAMETILNAISSGHRILFFSQFTSMLKIFINSLTLAKVPFFYLDGSTNSKLRTVMADSFNAGEKSVFLISLKAGGTGLNLTGSDVVIHFDQWWNPAVMAQASDRAHRYGQKNIVQVINFVAKDTIEEKIMLLQDKKKLLAESIIKEGGEMISKLTMEELKMIFGE